MREDNRGLKKNIFINTAYQIFKVLVPLIVAPYVARALGVESIGIYSFTVSNSAYFTLFAALGTESYGLREIARHRNDFQNRTRIFWEISVLSIFTSLIALFFWGVWILISDKYNLYYGILTFAILGVMFDISWFYSGMEEFKYSICQNVIFRIIGNVAIFIFVKSPGDLWVYILINMLMVFFANASMWIFLPRYVGKPSIDIHNIKKHLKNTLVYFVPTIATSIYNVLDKTLIGLITNDVRENGYYEEATKIINMASIVSFSGVNTVIQSRASHLFKEEAYGAIKKHISDSMDYLLFMGIGMAFGLGVIADRFVPLFFGTGFDETAKLIRILVPLVIIIGMSNCIGSQYYIPAGLRSKSARYIIIGAGVNFLLNLCMIPFFKSTGAALSTIIAESIISFLYIRNCDGFYNVITFFSQIWKKVISAIVMTIIICLIKLFFDDGLITLIIQIIIGFLVYIFMLVVLKDSFISNIVIPMIKKKSD